MDLLAALGCCVSSTQVYHRGERISVVEAFTASHVTQCCYPTRASLVHTARESPEASFDAIAGAAGDASPMDLASESVEKPSWVTNIFPSMAVDNVVHRAVAVAAGWYLHPDGDPEARFTHVTNTAARAFKESEAPTAVRLKVAQAAWLLGSLIPDQIHFSMSKDGNSLLWSAKGPDDGAGGSSGALDVGKECLHALPEVVQTLCGGRPALPQEDKAADPKQRPCTLLRSEIAEKLLAPIRNGEM